MHCVTVQALDLAFDMFALNSLLSAYIAVEGCSSIQFRFYPAGYSELNLEVTFNCVLRRGCVY